MKRILLIGLFAFLVYEDCCAPNVSLHRSHRMSTISKNNKSRTPVKGRAVHRRRQTPGKRPASNNVARKKTNQPDSRNKSVKKARHAMRRKGLQSNYESVRKQNILPREAQALEQNAPMTAQNNQARQTADANREALLKRTSEEGKALAEQIYLQELQKAHNVRMQALTQEERSADTRLQESLNHAPKKLPNGFTGLTWFGMHCYANTVFQLLKATGLMEWLANCKNKNNLALRLEELLRAMSANEGNIISESDLKALYKAIGKAVIDDNPAAKRPIAKELGNNTQPQDPAILLDELLKALPAEISHVFQIDSSNIYTHDGNHECSAPGSSTLMMRVPYEIGQNTLQTLIADRSYLKVNWVGAPCKTCRVARYNQEEIRFRRLPKVLVVTLPRVDKRRLPIEQEINLHEENANQNKKYRLKAIANFSAGHYTADVKKDNTWFCCDGARVTQSIDRPTSDHTSILASNGNETILLYELVEG
ncbi:hypothetical protein FACS189472_05120 [Alphaproteobacteria bacterium]|nr:hypothetical protein FACS189472_05120 [Alphaproteobacteria bacterium]